jgi:hypothetical protein
MTTRIGLYFLLVYFLALLLGVPLILLVLSGAISWTILIPAALVWGWIYHRTLGAEFKAEDRRK